MQKKQNYNPNSDFNNIINFIGEDEKKHYIIPNSRNFKKKSELQQPFNHNINNNNVLPHFQKHKQTTQFPNNIEANTNYIGNDLEHNNSLNLNPYPQYYSNPFLNYSQSVPSNYQHTLQSMANDYPQNNINQQNLNQYQQNTINNDNRNLNESLNSINNYEVNNDNQNAYQQYINPQNLNQYPQYYSNQFLNYSQFVPSNYQQTLQSMANDYQQNNINQQNLNPYQQFSNPFLNYSQFAPSMSYIPQTKKTITLHNRTLLEVDEFHKNGNIKRGKKFLKDGSVFDGTYDEDGKIIAGTITTPNKSTFQGIFYKNRQLYRGIKKFSPSGTEYDGIYDKDGKIISGTITIPKKKVKLQGVFDKNRKLRQGTKKFSNGIVHNGTYDENGNIIEGTITEPSENGKKTYMITKLENGKEIGQWTKEFYDKNINNKEALKSGNLLKEYKEDEKQPLK